MNDENKDTDSEKKRPYTTVALPDGMIKLIDDILDDETLGFQSRAEVVKQAVRELYNEYFGIQFIYRCN